MEPYLNRKVKIFYDAANFLKRGERALGWEKGTGRPNASQISDYFKRIIAERASKDAAWENAELSDIYWYDGAYPPEHPLAQRQAAAFVAIQEVPEITVRAGKIAEMRHPAKRYVVGKAEEALRELGIPGEDFRPLFRQKLQGFKDRKQKGVDVLLVADMLMGAISEDFQIAFLVSGDGDFADVCRRVKAMGCLVVVVSPTGDGFAPELRTAGSEMVVLSPHEVRRMLYKRKGASSHLRQTASENIAISITHRGRVPVSFGVTATAEEQEAAWKYASDQGWEVRDVPVHGHPASALPTVAAYNIEVSLDDWRDWNDDFEGCFNELFGED